MGRLRKQRKSNDELFYSISTMIAPEFILKDFEVSDIKEIKNEWVVELEEKPDQIPELIKYYLTWSYSGEACTFYHNPNKNGQPIKKNWPRKFLKNSRNCKQPTNFLKNLKTGTALKDSAVPN